MGKKLVRGVGAVLLALVVVLLGAVAVVLWRPELLRGQIERFASSQLHRAVRIAGPIRLEPGSTTVVELNDIQVAAPEWATEPNLARLDRLRVGLDVAAWWADDRIVLTELTLDSPKIALERDAQGRTSWPELNASSDQPSSQPSQVPKVESLLIEDGAVSYRDMVADVQLDARITSTNPTTGGAEAGLHIVGDGTARGKTLELDVETGSPTTLANREQPFPLSGAVSLGDSRLTVEGQIENPAALDGVNLSVRLESPDPAPLLALTGNSVPSGQVGSLSLIAHLTREGPVFAANDVALDWGESHAEGALSYDVSGSRPKVEGQVRATLIDIVALEPVIDAATAGDPDDASSESTPSPLATHDGRLELRIERLRVPDVQLTDIEAVVQLENGRFLADPLRLAVPEGEVSGRLALDDLDAGSFDGELALAASGADLSALLPDSGVGGTLDADLSARLSGSDIRTLLSQSELNLTADITSPVLPRLDGSLSDLTLKAALSPAEARPLSVQLQAQLNDEPAHIDIRGGPLGALLEEPITYPLTLDVDVGRTKAKLDGTLAWPLTAGGLDMQISLDTQGFDLSRVLGEDAPVGGQVTAQASGHLRGGSLSEILSESQFQAEGELTRIRLPQLGQRLQSADLEIDLAPGTEQPLDVRLSGRLDGKPLDLTATATGVERLAGGGNSEVPVEVHLAFGETEVDAKGTLAWPLEREILRLDVQASGPDPAQVLAPLDLPEIKLPPYQLAGEVARDGSTWRIAELTGKVGDSDISGDMTLDLGGERPAVSGRLHSDVLDLDDLLGLVGAEPGTGPGETASGQQRAEAERKDRDDQVLPEQRLEAESWRKVDLDLALEAANVRAGILPFDGFAMQVVLTNGNLRVDPLELRLGDGRLKGAIEVDGSQQPVRADLEAEVTRLPMGQLLKRIAVDPSSFGTLSGRIRGGAGIEGQGKSIAEILGNADGAVTLMMEGGRINRQIVDLLGFDLLNLFGSLLGARSPELQLNCTLADLAIKDGVVSTRSLVIDTDAANLAGRGTIDLASEAIDIDLLTRTRGTPLPSGRTGVTIGGTLANPEISYDVGTLAVRGAAAATLGVLLRPFTAVASAILPGSDPANNRGGCGALLKEVPGAAGG